MLPVVIGLKSIAPALTFKIDIRQVINPMIKQKNCISLERHPRVGGNDEKSS